MGKKKSTSDADASAEPTRKSPRFQAKLQQKKTKETPTSEKVEQSKPEDKPIEPQKETVETPTKNGEVNPQEQTATADEALKKEDTAEEKEKAPE